MKIFSFLKYQTHRYLLRKRWLLTIPLGWITGYWASYIIKNGPLPVGNALEAFIWAFGKPEIVYFLFSMLWIFLISDLALESPNDTFVLLRMGARGDWWLGKVTFILESTAVFVMLLLAGFSTPVLSKYPLSNQWSDAALADFGMILGYSTIKGSPAQAFLHTMLLLFTGWFAIGLWILVINLLSRRNWPGFLAGVVMVVCSKLGSIRGGPIGGSGVESYFLLQNHLEYTPLWAPVRSIPEIYSWIFWLFWIAICLAASRVIYYRRNFCAIDRIEE